LNKLKEDGDMAGTSIMAGIYSSSSTYPIEKIGDSPYLYSVNAGISVKMETGSDNIHGNKFICHL